MGCNGAFSLRPPPFLVFGHLAWFLLLRRLPQLFHRIKPGFAGVQPLLGEPLRPTPLSAERREKLEEQLDYARQVFEKNPDDLDALIWLG